MEDIAILRSAWIFDEKGNIKNIKNEADRARSKQIFLRARQGLRYVRSVVGQQPLRRLSFVNDKEQWTITLTQQNEIIVMHKDESLS